jgi:hypothetical protein
MMVDTNIPDPRSGFKRFAPSYMKRGAGPQSAQPHDMWLFVKYSFGIGLDRPFLIA